MKKKVETNKRAGWNKRAGRKVFSKLINVQTKIRPYRGEFFPKINKRAGTLIKFEEKFPPKRCFSWNKKEIRILIYQLAGQFHPTLL